MYDELKKLISENESDGDFTYTCADENIIYQAETELGTKIPKQYRWFLENYGQGGMAEIEVLGVGKSARLYFVEKTLSYREYGLPDNLIVIEDCDEWLFCINVADETIVEWEQEEEGYEVTYESFVEYLLDRIHDVIEDM